MKKSALAILLLSASCSGCSLLGFAKGFQEGTQNQEVQMGGNILSTFLGPIGKIGVVLLGGIGYGLYRANKEE